MKCPRCDSKIREGVAAITYAFKYMRFFLPVRKNLNFISNTDGSVTPILKNESMAKAQKCDECKITVILSNKRSSITFNW